MSDNDLDLYDSLKWRKTLQLLLNGDIDYAARALGGIEPYIERQLTSASNRARADSALAIALNDEVTSWQVGRSTSVYYVTGVVQLIGAFTPPAGFGKCIQVVEGQIDLRLLEHDVESLHMAIVTAVASLARYYPTAPPNGDADNAYVHYRRLLSRLSADPDLAPLAIRQQLRLGLRRLDDSSFIADAVKSESIMRVAVDYAVSEPDPWSAEQLAALLNACVATGLPEALSQYLVRLESYDVPVMTYDDHVLIVPADGLKVTVFVKRELLAAYVTRRWNVKGAEGLKRLLELYN